MEDKKLNECTDEILDTVSGGGKRSIRKKIDMNRLADGPVKYCDTCRKHVTSKVAYNQKTYCPNCCEEI